MLVISNTKSLNIRNLVEDGTNKYIEELKRLVMNSKRGLKTYSNSREKNKRARTDKLSGIDDIVNNLKRYRKVPQRGKFLQEAIKKNNRSVSMPRSYGKPFIDSTQPVHINCNLNPKGIPEHRRSKERVRKHSSGEFDLLSAQSKELYNQINGSIGNKVPYNEETLNGYVQAKDTTKSSNISIGHNKVKSEYNTRTIPVIAQINSLLEMQEDLSVEDMHFCFVSFYQKKNHILKNIET